MTDCRIPSPPPELPKWNGWYIQAVPGGVMIAPVYNGNFGCRLWHVRTIGL